MFLYVNLCRRPRLFLGDHEKNKPIEQKVNCNINICNIKDNFEFTLDRVTR